MSFVFLLGCFMQSRCPEVRYVPQGEIVEDASECTNGALVRCDPYTCDGEEYAIYCVVPPEHFTDWLLAYCDDCYVEWDEEPWAMVAGCEQS